MISKPLLTTVLTSVSKEKSHVTLFSSSHGKTSGNNFTIKNVMLFNLTWDLNNQQFTYKSKSDLT